MSREELENLARQMNSFPHHDGFIPHDWRSKTMPCDPETIVDTIHMDGILRSRLVARWLCWGRWTEDLVIVAWRPSPSHLNDIQ